MIMNRKQASGSLCTGVAKVDITNDVKDVVIRVFWTAFEVTIKSQTFQMMIAFSSMSL